MPKQHIASQMVPTASIPSHSRGLINLLEKEKGKRDEEKPGPGAYE